ncbi:MAG: NAD(P)/FAD-dependent oxidoreductase [Candidatus Didemnitutus sp.]|nr:NAD(P)/FAD-dependent oxidoreductase [Candidatus Didemnitutus sp.]
MAKPKHYDLICIGGGSAGFSAARIAAGLGKKTAIIDGAKELGGLCILKGCMPSKTLLYAAEILHHARHADRFGLRVRSATADMRAVHQRKQRIIGEFAAYRQQAMAAGKFDLYRAYAQFEDPHTLRLSTGQRLRADFFLVGTGSTISVPPVPGLKEAKCWTSDDVLDLDFLPKSVIVLGGGIVACELAQFLRRMGSKVTQVQRSAHVLSDHPAAAAAVVQRALVDEGIELFTGTQIQKITQDRRGSSVRFSHQGKIVTRRAAHLFNALGREPNTVGLDLTAAKVRTRPNGQIITNRWQQTSAPHIYGAGDCSGPVEIVHIAIQQAELAVRHAFKVKGIKPVDFSMLLSVVFTDPQLATVGWSEEQLAKQGTKYLVASYPFDDHGKSILMEAKYGHVKVWAEPKRGRILGAEIVGKDAGELIHCFSVAMALRATVFDLLKAPWYHPTLAEIITYPLEELAESISGS